jgi:putative redox protein
LTAEKLRLASTGGVELEGHLAVPDDDAEFASTGVIFLHGFPSGEVWSDRIGADLPELADRAAAQLRWFSLAVRFRGCGESTGDFSLQGWIEDVSAAVEYLYAEHGPERIWVCGFGTGGAVGLIAAAEDRRVSGVAIAGSPADFDDWAANPNRLLAHAKQVGAISGSTFPDDLDDWKDQLRRIRAVEAAEVFAPRPLLVIHGSEDELVPHFDARLLADAHRGADLRVIGGASHQLRHDPRAVAVLLGWLGRQESQLVA